MRRLNRNLESGNYKLIILYCIFVFFVCDFRSNIVDTFLKKKKKNKFDSFQIDDILKF